MVDSSPILICYFCAIKFYCPIIKQLHCRNKPLLQTRTIQFIFPTHSNFPNVGNIPNKDCPDSNNGDNKFAVKIQNKFRSIKLVHYVGGTVYDKN